MRRKFVTVPIVAEDAGHGPHCVLVVPCDSDGVPLLDDGRVAAVLEFNGYVREDAL